jgi:hypothetical protein
MKAYSYAVAIGAVRLMQIVWAHDGYAQLEIKAHSRRV